MVSLRSRLNFAKWVQNFASRSSYYLLTSPFCPIYPYISKAKLNVQDECKRWQFSALAAFLFFHQEVNIWDKKHHPLRLLRQDGSNLQLPMKNYHLECNRNCTFVVKGWDLRPIWKWILSSLGIYCHSLQELLSEM